MDLSIIIINYMTYEKTVAAAESVFRHTEGIEYEIILIDNGSENDDADRLESYVNQKNSNIKYIRSDVNSGFSKGNNLAAKYAEGKYIAFLNSDVELTSNVFYKAVEYMNVNRKTGALGCRVILPDGKLDHGCRRGFPTPEAALFYFMKLDRLFKNSRIFGKYRMAYLDEFEISETDAVSGAFLVTSRHVLERVGLFDERFFMYGEDIDLCLRIKENGFNVVYNPEIGTVIHYKGASGSKRKIRTIYNFYEAMILFYNKHYRKKYNILVTAAVYLAIGLLFLTNVVRNLLRVTGDR